MTKVPMTIRGAQLLRDELVKLKSDDRPKVIQAIADTGAESLRDMGKVMGQIKTKAEGRADMAAVGKKVKERLT